MYEGTGLGSNLGVSYNVYCGFHQYCFQCVVCGRVYICQVLKHTREQVKPYKNRQMISRPTSHNEVSLLLKERRSYFDTYCKQLRESITIYRSTLLHVHEVYWLQAHLLNGNAVHRPNGVLYSCGVQFMSRPTQTILSEDFHCFLQSLLAIG
jgi:hypothetical protein